jgi:hypothetical protein
MKNVLIVQVHDLVQNGRRLTICEMAEEDLWLRSDDLN